MGIINHGILGGFSGKVGPIVGFRWKSNYYIRSRAAKVSNPRTPKQQAQRGKFSTVFSFLKTIKPFIRLGYKEFSQEKSAFNSAMSYMLKKAVNSNGTEITIDFNRALVSMGTLMPVFNGYSIRCVRGKCYLTGTITVGSEMQKMQIWPCCWFTTRIKKLLFIIQKRLFVLMGMPNCHFRMTGMTMN